MYWFYTVISKECQPQSAPQLSLGGFCSSTKVLSGMNQAVFSSISELTLEKNRAEYICLVLKNTFESRKSNVKMWIEVADDALCRYRVGICAPSSTGEFESVVNSFVKPYYVEFEDITGINNAISLPDMDPHQMYGVWIERTVDVTGDAVKNRKNCDYLNDHFGEEISQSEVFNIKVEFD